MNYLSNDSTEDLKIKAKRSLKKIINNCNNLSSLEPLLKIADHKILKHILTQYDKHLKNDNEYKKQFINNGSLSILQQLKSNIQLPDELKQKIDKINRDNFHEDLVNFYSPEFRQKMDKKLEEMANNMD
jgi:hypothetical protein